jgi:hypothetical protein
MPYGRPTADLRTDVVVLACAISAGIHGALVRDHFAEGTGAGIGFLVSAFLLALLALTLRRRPSALGFAAAAVLFAGLIAAYALVVTTGFPLLHPEREGVEGLALLTKAVEAVGLVAAATLVPRPSVAFALSRPKGTFT